MNNNGKYLERLVSQVEKYFLQENFEVKTNERVFNEDGIPIAEFDIEIRGKLGTTEIKWLIECRDRPSQGPAPVSWIEQLVGRKSRFNFNKVTAVSSTGFAKGVKEFADNEDVELRTVKELSLEDIKSWCGLSEMILFKDSGGLYHVDIFINKSTDKKILNEVKPLFDLHPDQNILFNEKDKKYNRPIDLFQSVVNKNKHLYENIIIGERKPINMQLDITDEYPFFIKTKFGEARIDALLCNGYIIRTEERVPIDKIVEYSNDGKEKISQLATIRFSVDDSQFELNAHKIKADGRTIISVNKI